MGLNSSIICKVVPKYSMQMQAYDIAYMPILLLVGMLAGLLPLLVIISNIFTKPLRHLPKVILISRWKYLQVMKSVKWQGVLTKWLEI